jgi:hypothetical protein
MGVVELVIALGAIVVVVNLLVVWYLVRAARLRDEGNGSEA